MSKKKGGSWRESAWGAASVVSTSPPSRPTFFLRSERQRPVTWSVSSGGTRSGAASAAGGWWDHRGTQLRRRRRSWSGGRASSSSTGPRAEAPEGSGLLLPAAQPGGSPATEEERAGTARPKCWAAASSLSRPGGGSSGPGGHATVSAAAEEKGTRSSRLAVRGPDAPTSQPDSPTALTLHRFSLRHLRAPPPLRMASSSGAPARTREKRQRSAVRRSFGSPFPLAGRAVSMGHPPLPPPLPPPPLPPLGAVSMARRKRRSASSATQVDLASTSDLGGGGGAGWGSRKGAGTTNLRGRAMAPAGARRAQGRAGRRVAGGKVLGAGGVCRGGGAGWWREGFVPGASVVRDGNWEWRAVA